MTCNNAKIRLWDMPNPRKPDWFRRGCTLQELLAPKTVRFYDREWVLLGTEAELAPHIQNFAAIEASAVHGKDIGQFSILQRFRWAKDRVTIRPEDIIYSLLGLFRVDMQFLYGEGETQALVRLINEHGKMGEFERPPGACHSRNRRSYAVAGYVDQLELQERENARPKMRLPTGFQPIYRQLS